MRFLVNLWDKEGGSPWQSFYRGAKVWSIGQGRRPDGQPMWPKALQFVPNVR
jgi:hypothetical protein